MPLRVAILGIYHESNTFFSGTTTLEDFKHGHWLKADAIRLEYEQAHHEIGGMLEVLDEEQVEAVPVMFAEATPGGIVSEEAYTYLLQDMLKALPDAYPLDGCLVVIHGAAVCERFQDMDGHWLTEVRKILHNIPLIGTIDPHANVSQLMVNSTDALIAYSTNPHIDQRETGKRAAKLMVQYLKNNIKPWPLFRALPLAISIEQQCTTADPCKTLFSFARQLESDRGVLSVSIILGFPYADVIDMGSSVIVIVDGENNMELAKKTVDKIEHFVLSRLNTFDGNKKDISAAWSDIEKYKKPILILDMGDNVGGGAPGNSLFLLEAFEKHDKYRYFICLFDPGAVSQAKKKLPGEKLDLFLDGEYAENTPKKIRVKLEWVKKGNFKDEHINHGGQVHYNMGKIALVTTDKGNTIMLTSLRVPPFSLNQLTAFNVIPKDFDLIVAKGVNAPIAAYEKVCSSIIKIDTPGVTQANMINLPYKNRRKPLFPFEKSIKQ